MSLVSIPKLADLVSNPQRVAEIPPEAIAAMRGELARLDTLLLTRLFSGDNSKMETGRDGDRLLSTKEAAAKLGTSADWLYRHSRTLPFVVHIGRKVLFSEAGVEKYIRQRMGR